MKYIVLLANSKKYGERCIAGIELQKSKGSWSILRNSEGLPKWIRPVSNSKHGEISASIADQFSLLDVVEIDIAEEVPKGFQAENCLIQSISKTGNVRISARNLQMLTDRQHSKLFNFRGRSVSVEYVKAVDYSLMLIEPENFVTIAVEREFGKVQKRGQFTYQGNDYDLPITDVDFVVGSEKGKKCFLTISLGVEYEGWHYKLIAGVVSV